jgi:hypothetical protein
MGNQETKVESTSRVLEMLREQAALYGRLEDHARRQRLLVTGADATPLLGLLADRQRLSAELAELGAALTPVRVDWEMYRGALSEPERDEADQLVAQSAAALSRVIESDEEDARVLAARRSLTARELQSTRAGRAAMAAYRGAGDGGGARLNHLDEAM